MLTPTSPKVAACLEKAAEARRRARSAARLEDREFWQQMEPKWIRLAESYVQTERLDDFIGPQKNQFQSIILSQAACRPAHL